MLLTELLGGKTYFTGSADRAVRDAVADEIARDVIKQGGRPVILPAGGSDAVGALGHALLGHEVAEQCGELDEDAIRIVVATATGGTQAGLIAGLRAIGADAASVQGYTVHRSAIEASVIVRDLVNELARVLSIDDCFDDGDVVVDDSQLGGGYGVPTDEGADAIRMLARTEGLLLDPVYTAKAMAGLLAMIRSGGGDHAAVVFVHTGGAPALFAETAATQV
jgi:1-aminocyclopropane-1-carboxylate deaminase/D-cysteine desulfhydrase-like pyridoxal-dependent ACC family enzyme